MFQSLIIKAFDLIELFIYLLKVNNSFPYLPLQCTCSQCSSILQASQIKSNNQDAGSRDKATVSPWCTSRVEASSIKVRYCLSNFSFIINFQAADILDIPKFLVESKQLLTFQHSLLSHNGASKQHRREYSNIIICQNTDVAFLIRVLTSIQFR